METKSELCTGMRRSAFLIAFNSTIARGSGYDLVTPPDSGKGLRLAQMVAINFNENYLHFDLYKAQTQTQIVAKPDSEK